MTMWISIEPKLLKKSLKWGLILAFPILLQMGCSVTPATSRGRYDRDTGTYVGGAGQAQGSVEAWNGFKQTGEISYYAKKFEGNRTANGETYHGDEMTAAHRELPFGVHLKVTNLKNGKSVIVRVNDRGPFAKDRILDVSQSAAKKLGLMESGTAKARIELVAP